MTEKELYLNHEDLILNDKQIGGFSVQNIMDKLGMSPIMTINSDLKFGGGNGGNVSDLFKDLAVPSWATMYHMQKGGYEDDIDKNKDSDSDNDSDSDSDVGEDLHDKLLELVKDTDRNGKNDYKGGKKKTKNNNKKDKKNKKITKKYRLK
jgi:hypothetical protein